MSYTPHTQHLSARSMMKLELVPNRFSDCTEPPYRPTHPTPDRPTSPDQQVWMAFVARAGVIE